MLGLCSICWGFVWYFLFSGLSNTFALCLVYFLLLLPNYIRPNYDLPPPPPPPLLLSSPLPLGDEASDHLGLLARGSSPWGGPLVNHMDICTMTSCKRVTMKNHHAYTTAKRNQPSPTNTIIQLFPGKCKSESVNFIQAMSRVQTVLD